MSQPNKTFRLAARRQMLVLVAVVVLFASLLASFKFGQNEAFAVPSTLNFQARLMNAAGAIAPDGDYNVEFKIYNASTSSGSSQGSCTGDSNCLWTETRTSANKIHVANGYLTANLGSVTAFSGINWGDDLWMTMNVGGSGSPSWDGEMSPRLKLTAVPFAFSTSQLAAGSGANTTVLNGGTPSGNNTISLPAESGTLCIQNSSNCGFLTTGGGGGSFIVNGTSLQVGANFNIQSTAAGSVGGAIRGAASQTANLFQLQDSSGNVNAAFNGLGNILTLGRIAGSGTVTAGSLLFADGTTDGFGAELNTSILTADRTISLPDEDGVVCLQNSTDCGFQTTGGGSGFVHFAPAVVQADSSTNNTIFINKTGASGNIVQIQRSGVDKFVIANSGNLALGTSTAPNVFTVNGATTADSLAQALISTGATTNKGVVVQGVASQTADLMQLQDSTGSVLGRFTASGHLGLNSTASTSQLGIVAGSSGTIGAIIQGASGQTADLLRMQGDNGVILAQYDANANLTSNGTNNSFLNLAVPVFTTSPTGTSFYYVITAVNGQGETVASSSLGMTNNTSNIQWTQVAGASGYKIYRNTTNSFTSGSLLLTTITNGATVSYTDSGSATSAGLPPAAPAGTTLIAQGWAGQASNIFQVQNSGGTGVLGVDTTKVTLGRVASSGSVIPGKLVFADGTTDNFGSTVDTNTLTANRAIHLPDEDGIVCLRNSANCGFAVTGGGGSFIVNGTSTQFNANFNIQSTGAAAVGGVISGVNTQTADLFQLQDNVGNVNAAFSALGNQLTLGRVAGSGTVTAGSLRFADGTTDNFAATLNTTTLTANRTLSLPDAGGTICTDVFSTCGGTYQAAGNYLLKNAQDSSTAAIAGYLLSFTNSNTGSAAGVLALNNGGTASSLSVVQSANPDAGQAVIVANNTAGSPTGNLLDLQTSGTSKFSVSAAGAATAIGVNSTTGLLQGTGGLTVTGAVSINTTGTANTAIGNATGTFTLDSNTLDISSGGALSGVTGYAQASGNFSQSGTGTFGTGTGTVSLNGDTTIAAGKNLALSNGAGTFTQNFTATTGTAATFAITDNATTGTTTVQGVAINLIGTNNATGSNTITGLNFGNVAAATNNTFHGINFGTGFSSLLRYNGATLIDGSGILQNAAIGSGVNYSNLTQVGALTGGSIASGFGTIATTNTITGTVLNATTSINTGAGAGTARIDASGNLTNIGNINASGTVTFSALTTDGPLYVASGVVNSEANLSVIRGGTGIGSTTAYGVLTGGTTSTGAFQNAGTGSSGQILQSNGAGALPVWVNATATNLCSDCLIQNPLTTARNTIAPTTNSVVALTVKGTTGTAARVIEIYDSTATPTLQAYFDATGSLNVSQLIQPTSNNAVDLGTSSTAFRSGYFATSVVSPLFTGQGAVTISSGGAGALALQPSAGGSLTGAVTKNAATGNEVAYDLAAVVNKATSGNYTGIKLNVTETNAPGAANLLADLQVGGATRFSVSSAGAITAATSTNTINGLVINGGTISTGVWQGTTVAAQYGGTGINGSSAANGTLLIGNGSGYSLATLTGTANRLNVTNGAGSITLDIDATQFPSSTVANTILRSTGAGAASWVSNTQANICTDCANTSLSNLSNVAINTSLLSGSATIDLGSNANPFRDLYLGGTATDNFRFTGTATGGAKTITLDNLSGSLGLIQTAGSSTAQTGDLNVSGTLIAGTALQGTLFKSADGAGASSGVTFRSGNTTGGSGLSTGTVAIKSGDGSGTNTSSGNVSLDSGSVTGTGTAGTISIGGTNASALTLGRTGLTTTAAGGLTVAANQNLTLLSGTGVLGQTYSNNTGTAATFAVTNNASTGTTTVQGMAINLTGTNNGTGTNTITGLNFGNVAAATNNTFNGISFGTGFSSLLQYNGTTLISGAGKVQDAAIDSAVTYTNLQKVGVINTGTWQGSIVDVSYGGTGVASTTAYGLLAGGTTSTGAFQNVGTGSAGQILQSQGASALPTWVSATGASICTDCLIQNPLTSGRNTITPTTNSVVGLTVNGTSGTAAQALIVNQSGNANAAEINTTNTGTQTNGLLVQRNNGAGTTTNLLNLTNTAGTVTNAIAISGTFTNQISGNNFTVNNAGAVSAVGVNSGSGLLQGTGGLTISGTTAINTTGTANTSIGNATGTFDLTSSGLNVTTAGALSGITGYTQTSGNFQQSGAGTFSTGTGAISLNGDTTIAAGKNLTLASGTGVLGQTYTNTTGTAATFAITDSATSGTTTVQGVAINLTGTNNAGGTNTITGLNFGNVTPATNNNFRGISFGTGFDSLLNYNGSVLIDGTGKLQNSAISTGVNYSNLTQVGTLTSGALGAGFTTVNVAQGGTGATTFTTNGVLYGNGTGAVASTAAGTTGQCLLGSTSNAPFWGTCATGSVTIQAAYDNSSTPELVLHTPQGALTVRDNSTPLGANLLEIQSNDGSVTYLAVDASGISVTGTIAATSTITGTTLNGTTGINTGAGAGTNRIDNTGNLVNIGTINASGAVTAGTYNSQTISSAANFTGTVNIQGANALTLGTSSTNTGAIIFLGSGGAGTLRVAGPTTPNAGNYTLSIPAITANANICTDNSICSGYAAAPVSGNFIQQVPTSNTPGAAGANVIAPTAANIVGLTIKGTTGTAARVLEIYNSSATPTLQAYFDAAGSLNVSQLIQPTSNNAVDLGTSGTAFRTGYFATSLVSPALTTNGATALGIDTGGAAAVNIAGANANAVNIGNGTSNPNIAFNGSGTFGTTTGNVSLNGNTTVTGTGTFNVNNGLSTLNGGFTATGTAQINASSNNNTSINTGTSTGTVSIGNGAAGVIAIQSGSTIAITTTNFNVTTGGVVNTSTGFQIAGAATAGNFLRGNGTNFVSSAIQSGDVPVCSGSCNYIANQTTQQASSNFNISGIGVAATALQTPLLQTTDVTGASAGLTVRSGNSTTSGNTGALTLATGAATSGNSGNITIDSGTASGTTGTITIGGANASNLILGRTGFTTNSAGSLTIAANQNLTLASGTGVLSQTYANTTGTAATFAVTNSASSGTTSVQGIAVNLTGTNNAGGTNAITGLNFASVTPATNNTFNGISFGTGFSSLLQYNGTTLIDGGGKLQNAAIDSTVTYTNLQKVGTINTGTWQGSVVDVSYGGTGVASTTAYGLIAGGTTSTGAFQNVGTGSAGQILVSAGASALPAWTNPTSAICTDCIIQNPLTTARNTIAPTTNSVVALTVKGTTGTAARVIEIYDSTATPTLQAYFDASGSLNVSQVIQPTSNNAVDLGVTGTRFRTGYFGTSVITPALLTTGATALRVDTGGAAAINIGDTNANAINVGNGTTNPSVAFNGSGTFGTTTGAVSLNGNTTVTGSNTFTVNGGLSSLNAGLTAAGGTVNLNASSNNNTNINTGTSTGTIGIGNGAAGAITIQSGSTIALTGTNFSVTTGGVANVTTGFQIGGAATAGNYLRGNGTNFVSSGIQSGDVPACSGSCNYIANQTSQQASSNFNISGTGVAGVALQAPLLQTTDVTGASAGLTLRSGNSTSSGNSGGLTIATGNATSGNSGNITVDSGTASGTAGTITIGGTNASALTLGRSGLTTTAAGGLTVAANQNLTLNNGTGVLGQTYTNNTGTAATFAVTNNASSGTTTVQGIAVNLTGTNNAGGTNTITGLNFGNVAAATNNTFNGISFGTGFASLLQYNGTSLISGAGKVQDAAIDSTVTYTNLQKVGTINTGTWQGSVVNVAYGGTGVASTTAYGLIAGGTTSTGAFQNTGTGTAGQILVSAGASALPTWVSATGSNICTDCIIQNPLTTARNTIAPTTASVVALTVKGTTGTAARVIEVYDSTATPTLQAYFDATGSLNVSQLIQPTSNNAVDLGTSGTSFRTGYFATSVVSPALLSNGATALRVDTGGAAAINIANTNANAVNIGNVTTNPNIAFTGSGTFGTTTGAVSLNGDTTVTGTKTFTVNGGLASLNAGLTAAGGAIQLNASSNNNTTINTGTSTGTVGIGNGAAGAITVQSGSTIGITGTNFSVTTGGVANVTTGYQIAGAAASGNFLRGNGTNFVSSAIQSGDVPVCSGSCNYISNQTSQQASSNFNISGTGIAGVALQAPSFQTADVTGTSTALSLRSGNSTTSGNTGDVTIASGAATSGNSGNLSIDAGTASGTKGTISIGTGQASALTISKSGVTTTIQGALTVSELLTANGDISFADGAAGDTITIGDSLSGTQDTVTLNGDLNFGTDTDADTIVLGDTGNADTFSINSTGLKVTTAGALSGITTIATSSTINSQTISSTANFTGTVTIQGANALTLGVTGTSTGAALFKGATGASGTLTLIGQANPTNNTITLPNETGTVCTSAASSPANCTNFASAPASGNFIQQVPTSNTPGAAGANVIAPTAANIVGLTVKGTTGTAARVLEIYNSSATPTLQAYFDANGSLNVSQLIQPTSNNAIDLGTTGTRFRTGYFGTSVESPSFTGAGAVTVSSGAGAALALQPSAGGSITGAVTKNAATGNEVAYDLSATINKATSGNYTGIKLNVTETNAPGAGNLLADLQVGGATRFSVNSAGAITAANSTNTINGLVINGGTISTGVWQGTTVGVAYGGTGQTTYTDGQLLIGNSTGATLTKATLTGTANRLSVTNGGGSITLNVDATQFPSSTTNNTILKASGSGVASWVANTQANICSDCANTALSNLASVAINTSLLTGNATVDLGSNANPFRDLYLGGTATNNFRFTGTASGGAKTITLDNLSGNLALVQTAGSSSAQTGDINVSGTLIAATALQGTLVKSADTTGTSSAIVLRSGNSTSSGNTGDVTLSSGAATSGNSGNISIDAGTSSATEGSITIASANATALTLGRSSFTTNSAGSFSIAAGQNFTMQGGAGVLTQTYTSGTDGTSAQVLGFTNTNSGAGSTTVSGVSITPVGTTNGNSNANKLNAINLPNVTTLANNLFYGLNVGTGYNDILRYNGTQIISGGGKLQNAGIDSTVSYSNLQQVGTLTSGALGAGFTAVNVAQGGTGVSSTTAYGLLAGGTTSTAALQNVGTGTIGQILISQGAGALPVWTNASGAGVCSDCILQEPPSSAQNTITPTVASVVGLTVNATSGTATQALIVNQAQGADAVSINVTGGSQTNGVLVDRTNAGTLTNGVNITNTSGTMTNGLAFTGTIANDINRGSGILGLQGAGGIRLTATTGNISLDGSTAQFTESASARTLGVQTRTTNAAGTALTVQAGQGGSGASANAGGDLKLQGGNGGGVNGNGGNAYLFGGTKNSAGTDGNVILAHNGTSAIGNVGIGTAAPTRPVHISVSNTTINAPTLLVEQTNSGDSSMEFKNINGSFYAGVDTSDNDTFKLTSSDANNTTQDFGYHTIGANANPNNNLIICSKYTATVSGTITAMSAYVTTIDSSPNNHFAVALYSDNAGTPNVSLANSASAVLNANAWNTVAINASITNATTYWLCWNSDGTTNNLLLSDANGTTDQTKWDNGVTFGTWSAFSQSGNANAQLSLYASVTTSSGSDSFVSSLFSLSTSGQTLFKNSSNSTTAFRIQNAAGTNQVSLDTTNATLNLGTNGTDAQAGIVNIGTSTGSTQQVRLGSTSSGTAAAGTLINIQGGTNANNAVTIGTNGAGGITMDTGTTGSILIGAGTSNNAKTITIGPTATKTSTTTIQIGVNVVGTETIQIGSATTNSAANGTTILMQGGNTSTAVSVQALASGTINIGSNNAANTVQIGSTTLSSGTQTIGIGNNNTSGGTTNITIGTGGTATGGTTTLQAKGDITFSTNGTVRGTFDDATNAIYFGNGVTAASPSAFTISGTGSSTTAVAGGGITLQGGNATVGAANGGNVTLTGGTGIGGGVRGLVVVDTPTFTTATTQNCGSNCNITQANIDSSGAVLINATAASLIVTLTDPTITTAGRIMYVTNIGTTNDFTLSVNGGGTGNVIAMKPNTTATMIWNGADWTAAGASSSTDLQSAYNNTLTSAGGAELVLNAPGGSADGLTIRNNATTPIIGGILEVQNSIGSNLLSVNNNATEYATNGGAETAGASGSTFPANTWDTTTGGTVDRWTTAGDNVATGQASVRVQTTTTNHGARNRISSSLISNLTYTASFAVRGAVNFATLDIRYSPDGTTTGTTECATAQTVTVGIWSRITCNFIASGTITSSNSMLIRQTDATARTFYIDNLSLTINASATYAADGSVDLALGTNWTQFDADGGAGTTTVTRDTTNIYDTSGAVSDVTTAANNLGMRNNLAVTPQVSTQYLITFYAKLLSGTFTNITVGFLPAGGNSVPIAAQQCTDYNTQTLSTSAWTKITCLVSTPSSGISDPDIVIYQPTNVARTFYVDALTMTLNTNTASNVQVGGANKGGPPTLFTLDRSNGSPIANNNDAYLGSMYYDTTSGRIQCYEADGWGACGAAPDNIVNLNPEYAGAVLNGTGIGTMTADFCGNGGGLSVNTTLCSSGQARNFYRWTSPQTTQQTYSIYVSYQLPATFNGFSSDDTVQLVGRVDNTTNASVTYEMYKSVGGTLTQCGTGETNVITGGGGAADTWYSYGVNGNESTGCSFSSSSASGFIIFKINMKANTGANAYVSTLSFTTTGR